MATMIQLDGLTGLRRMDPGTAKLGAALADLLEAAGFEATLLHAHDPGPWFACADAHFRIAGGTPLAEDRVSEAVALLDAAEPALEGIERSLGIALEPDRIVSTLPEPAALLGFMQGALAGILAIPLNHPARPRWESEAGALRRPAGKTPQLIRILVDGPRLPIPEAGDLATGDLLLIGARPGGSIEPGDGARLPGQLDLVSGNFVLHPQGAPMAADTNGSATSHDFAVPLTLRLPDRMVSAASLAALHPGAALPLGPITDGMPVELLVASRTLARGELVQLGDRFAVLIEDRVPLDAGDIDEPTDVASDADAAEPHA